VHTFYKFSFCDGTGVGANVIDSYIDTLLGSLVIEGNTIYEVMRSPMPVLLGKKLQVAPDAFLPVVVDAFHTKLLSILQSRSHLSLELQASLIVPQVRTWIFFANEACVPHLDCLFEPS